jgi:hypothetical protein
MIFFKADAFRVSSKQTNMAAVPAHRRMKLMSHAYQNVGFFYFGNYIFTLILFKITPVN